MSKTIGLIAVLFLISGCSSIEKYLPKPPANLASDCQEPVALIDDSMGSIADAATENASRLVDCRKKHQLLVESYKPS